MDADKDSCNTRPEVLLEEAVTAPTVGPGCKITGGTWRSYYDDTLVTNAGALDIDHMVPLAEAWDSGASGWTAAMSCWLAGSPTGLPGAARPRFLRRSNRGRSCPPTLFSPARSPRCAVWILSR